MTNNRYFRVTKPMPAWHLALHMMGNEWIGRSRCLWPIYQPITLNKWDEIHELVGGVFGVMRGGQVLDGLHVMNPPVVQSIMLKTYGDYRKPGIAEIAQGFVEEISKSEATNVSRYRREIILPTLSLEEGLQKTSKLGDGVGIVGRVIKAEFEKELMGDQAMSGMASEETIKDASYAFWGKFSEAFPEVTSGDSQLSGEDRAALAIWRNGDPGDEPVQRMDMTLTPEWRVSQKRITQAVRDGLEAAGAILFEGKEPPPAPPEVVAQLDSCVKHILYYNPPEKKPSKKASSGMGM